MRTLWQRVLAFLRGRRLESDLSAEIEAHLEMQEAEFRERGMDAAAARAAALRDFGGVAQAMEDYRERRGLPWLEALGRDIHYGLRGLRRNPGFTAAAVISLALGIGANTAIFSLFHAVMLRLLPVERPQELVSLYRTGGWSRGFVSYPLYREIAARTDLFSAVFARTGVAKVGFNPRPGGRGQFCQRELVTGNYFQALGVGAAMGRVFTDEDNRVPGGHPVAVIGYDLWRDQFGADPGILGAKILVDEQPLTVIGVAAPGFHGVEVERRAEVWVPAMMAEMQFQNPRNWWILVMARRRPEVSERQVQAAMNVLMAQHLRAIYPTNYNAAFRQRALGQRLEVRDAGIGMSSLREDFGKPLTVLMAAVGLVLLAACANVANLLLARGAARRKETALRMSLGATRSRLVRQSLTECVLLAIGGGALGVALSAWGRRVLLSFLPDRAGDPFSAGPDNAALFFTMAIAAFSLALFGVGPALRSTAVDPAAGLRAGSAGRGGRPVLRRALVAAQVAFSVVLVALAALFGHNLFALRSVDLGFRNDSVIAFSLDFPRRLRSDYDASIRQLAGQLEQLPGVSSVSYGFPGPFLMGTSSASIRVPGSERTAREPADVDTAQIAPRYFETIGTPVLLGREFDSRNLNASRKIAVVNEAFVREFLPGEKHPDSRWLSFDDSKPEGGEPTYIVGVVRDVRHTGIQKPPRPTVYSPPGQGPSRGQPTIVMRTQAPVTALLGPLYRELSKVGRGISFASIGTLRHQVDESIYEQRMLAALGGFFGTLALVLAAVGLYGVVAYGTARRTSEIGIRIALGARRGQVIWMVLRDSLVLVLVGLAAGLPAALAAARAVESVLFGIRSSDPATFAATTAILAAIGIAAALLPARRAAGLEPGRVLRHE
ncbi:MAG TPA: ABC transporter permease [Candidatus Acidoferrales bacterium]|nr:ABC transporter permease [Candidatus Acidoferrales bacterium]